MRKILALLAITLCFPALAAEPEPPAEPDIVLPDIAVTATRVPTALERLPAGVTIITRRMIEERGFNTLVDALAGVPGIRVSPTGGAGAQASLFVRGANSNHVLVLRDGMPINDPSEATGAFNFGVDTLSDVERIEIVRGPMAALYGSGAIGGVVNLISRQGRNQGVAVEGDLAGGAPASVRATVAATGAHGPIDFALTASSQSQRGYDSVPRRMSVFRGVPQGFRDRVGTLHLGYSPIEGTRVSLLLRGRQALFGFNYLGFPTWDNANASGSAESFLGRAGVVSNLLDGLWETRFFIGSLHDGRQYKQYLDPRDPNLASGDSRYNARRTDIQWTNTLRLGRFVQGAHLTDATVTFGAQHIADAIRVSSSTASFGFPFDQAANAAMTTNAVHAGAQVTLWERLDLTAQLRQDWVQRQAPFTWRLGAVARVAEIGTDFKLAYGTAFRAASLFDRYGVDSFGYVGNPSLRPERAQGWEAGFTTTIPAFGDKRFLTLGATYFNQAIQNLITTQFAPVYTSVNIGSARAQGVEVEATLRATTWLTTRVAYGYTDTLAIGAAPGTGSRLLRRPPHSVSVEATLTPLPGLSIVPRFTYTGAFRDFLYDDAGFPAGFGSSPGGALTTLAVHQELTDRIRLYLNAWNLFRSRFEPVNGFQTPGPGLLIGVRLRL
jgi:vitamin B12 transporter